MMKRRRVHNQEHLLLTTAQGQQLQKDKKQQWWTSLAVSVAAAKAITCLWSLTTLLHPTAPPQPALVPCVITCMKESGFLMCGVDRDRHALQTGAHTLASGRATSAVVVGSAGTVLVRARVTFTVASGWLTGSLVSGCAGLEKVRPTEM
jgi:hypothetical protein